jgi:hypothetical protein
MPERKILLLTDCPPNKHYSGSLMTISLLKLFPEYSFCCYVVVDRQLEHKEFDSSLSAIVYKFQKKRKESNESIFDYYLNKLIKFPILAKKIIKFAEANQVDCIWSILQGQNIICLTDIIMKNSKISVKVQIWDSFEWWLRARNVKLILQKKYLNIFDRVIKNANKIAVASYNMSEKYKEKYSRDSNVFVSFLDKKNYQNSLVEKFVENDDIFLIGFCGQLYAKNNFLLLFRALDQIEWKIDGKRIKLRMMTYIKNINDLESYFDNIKINNKNIELIGWVSTDETIAMLKECSLLYCPYWFDADFKLEAETSFPSKLTTYLASGRTVLMHAPEYSSPYCFLKKYNASLFCNDLSLESLIESIKQSSDKDLIDQIIINANKAFEENLTPSVAKQQMENFLSLN